MEFPFPHKVVYSVNDGLLLARVIDPPRARKYHAILEYSRIAWSSFPSSDIMPGYTASHSACKKTTNLHAKFYGKTALNGEIPVNKYQNNINHMS